jgi:hypothetical protein
MQTLIAGIELEVFTHIAAGKRTVKEIARAAKASLRGMEHLLGGQEGGNRIARLEGWSIEMQMPQLVEDNNPEQVRVSHTPSLHPPLCHHETHTERPLPHHRPRAGGTTAV